MSFATVPPEQAPSDLQSITTALKVGNAAAAVPTTGVAPPAADEVSQLTAAQFAADAARFQAMAARALAIHELVAATLAEFGPPPAAGQPT